MKSLKILILSLVLSALGLFVFGSGFNTHPAAQAAPDVYASPVHAGCYIAGPSDCRIHVEPFTITVNTSSKLIYFQLLANRAGTGNKVIYDWRPDVSNPLPISGSTVTPSSVTQDYAAICGAVYTVNLQARDTMDSNAYSLGISGQFTCPSGVP